MKGLKKTALCLFLACLMAISLLAAGCQNKASNETTQAVTTGNSADTTTEATTAKVAEPIEVGLFVANELTGTKNEEVYDAVSKKFLEDRGINLKFKFYGAIPDDVTNALQLRIASNEVDAWNVFGGAPQRAFLSETLCMQLDDLLKNYPVIMKSIPEDAWSQGKISGKTYQIPIPSSMTTGIVPWIRKDLLDKAGLSVPTTLEELYTAEKALLALDSKYIGITAGFSGWVYAQILGGGMQTSVENADGTLARAMWNSYGNYWRLDDPDTREWFKLMGKWFQEKVIDNEVFTTNDKRYQELLKAGRLTTIAADWTVFQTEADRRAGLDPAYPLEAGQTAEQWVIMDTLSWKGRPTIWSSGSAGTSYISLAKNTTHANEILTFIDWVNENMDNAKLCSKGIEGQHYNMENGHLISVKNDSSVNVYDGALFGFAGLTWGAEINALTYNFIGTEYKKIARSGFIGWSNQDWYVPLNWEKVKKESDDCWAFMDEWMVKWMSGKIPNTDAEIEKCFEGLKKCGYDKLYKEWARQYYEARDARKAAEGN